MAKFEIGKIFITRGVDTMATHNSIFADFVNKSFKKHCNGDWGDLNQEDQQTNEKALLNGDTLLSKYNFDNNTSIYIITEWDRSSTTILFPNEY